VKSIMTIRNALALSAALLFLGACATPGFEATHDYDDSVNFSSYRTFGWISTNPMRVGATTSMVSSLLEPRIMSSLERALVAKGYQYAKDPNNADFVLSFTVGARDELRVDSYPTMGGGYYGRGAWGGAYYGYGTETRVRQYTRGTLALDIFDVRQRRPVWHGVAEKKITSEDRDNQLATVEAAVTAIMAGFPPP